MKAHELRKGDEYRDGEGITQMTAITNASADGTHEGKPQIVVTVRYLDGGANLRWYDADAEVPWMRPEVTET